MPLKKNEILRLFLKYSTLKIDKKHIKNLSNLYEKHKINIKSQNDNN